MKRLNQRGLTLIEILAAVVILMIVIVGFMSFFAQATSHSRITEDKLTAINLAEKIMVEIKRDINMDIEDKYSDSIEINGEIYYPYVTFIREEEQTFEENLLELKRVKVEIFNESPDIATREHLTELYDYR